MKVINGENINEVFQIAVMSLREEFDNYIITESRNGPVKMLSNPLTTVYRRPNERVLFSPERNCNPFFHFIEALWMLDGRNDLDTLTMFAKKMADFSDDGVHVNGAYGYRWREYFGRDQLCEVIDRLRADPSDRRMVLQMWDAKEDLLSSSKDVPCNTQIYFKARPLYFKKPADYEMKLSDYYLDMTVTNRSNDLIWGMYGANAVHFSVLQEYVASTVGMKLGQYWQVSNNAHVYMDVWEPLNEKLPQGIRPNPYETQEVTSLPLVDKWEDFDVELRIFFDWLHEGDLFGYAYRNSVFPETAVPIVEAWWLWKEGMVNEAVDKAREIKSPDWRKACVEWLERKK
tara:strand:+ start:637 stop:1668 length:1032 start_codon:yes stop_codon:yes gene_type:complete